MEKPPRARWFVKWTVLSLCILIMAGWGASLVRHFGFGWGKCRVSLGDGCICFWELRTLGKRFEGWHAYSEAPWGQRTYGLTWVKRNFLKDGGTRLLFIPLWLPLLVLAIPAAISWRQVRRRLGHCRRCNYNLTGNISGTCPECGTKVTSSE